MWLILWQFQESSVYHLYGALFFGVTTGSLLAVNVLLTKKRLKIHSWEQWLKDNHFD
ncbi:DUF6404 family protein [Photobacterium sanguinicancri]|uniref:DUF6404 family protein n=1 Tax=Photobacterium sanguinicancri TaxID=875932 RepID=UPI001EFD4327|nr:DUF6404 family protein [Photobacterium sanguinicancri]